LVTAALCSLISACDPGWNYRIPDRPIAFSGHDEPPTYRFQLVGGTVEYRVRSAFFAGGILVWSAIENHGKLPIVLHIRDASLRTADGREVPLDGLFEGEAIRTGFYAAPNHGDEFRTGVKTIGPGEA
jgi:hypothetical protein